MEMKKNTIGTRFLDSCRFIPSSLEKLAAYLPNNDLLTVKSIYQNPNVLYLMKRKRLLYIYDVDYLDSVNRLEETELQPRSCFF